MAFLATIKSSVIHRYKDEFNCPCCGKRVSLGDTRFYDEEWEMAWCSMECAGKDRAYLDGWVMNKPCPDCGAPVVEHTGTGSARKYACGLMRTHEGRFWGDCAGSDQKSS